MRPIPTDALAWSVCVSVSVGMLVTRVAIVSPANMAEPICLELGADLHMAQLMPLPLTVSCFSKIQIGFTFLVPAHLGSPEQMAVKRVCVRVRVCYV